MNMIKNNRGNAEIIPAVVCLFIVLVCLYFTIYAISPVLSIIPMFDQYTDADSPVYVDVLWYFDAAVRGFAIMIGLIVGIQLLHILLLAIKKQKYSGAYNDSDF